MVEEKILIKRSRKEILNLRLVFSGVLVIFYAMVIGFKSIFSYIYSYFNFGISFLIYIGSIVICFLIFFIITWFFVDEWKEKEKVKKK